MKKLLDAELQKQNMLRGSFFGIEEENFFLMEYGQTGGRIAWW